MFKDRCCYLLSPSPNVLPLHLPNQQRFTNHYLLLLHHHVTDFIALDAVNTVINRATAVIALSTFTITYKVIDTILFTTLQ